LRVRLRFANRPETEQAPLEAASEPAARPEDLATSLALLSHAMSGPEESSIREEASGQEEAFGQAAPATDERNREDIEPPPAVERRENGHGPETPQISKDSLTAMRAALLHMASLLHQESDRAPASLVTGTQHLRNRRIALVNFQTDQSTELRLALESQGAAAASLAPSATNLSLVCQVFDMLVWAVPGESELPTEGELDELRARRRPVLWVGPSKWVTPLVRSQPPGLWDYVENLHPLEQPVWRVGMQLSLNPNHRGQPGAARQAGPDTVLVLDDNPLSRALVERTLGAAGVACLKPPEDVPALEFIRQSRPSVVVMELKTSTEQGFDLLQRIRLELDLASTRVVVLSEQREEADVVRAFGLGVDDFITKPFSPLELAARVMRLVRPL